MAHRSRSASPMSPAGCANRHVAGDSPSTRPRTLYGDFMKAGDEEQSPASTAVLSAASPAPLSGLAEIPSAQETLERAGDSNYLELFGLDLDELCANPTRMETLLSQHAKEIGRNAEPADGDCSAKARGDQEYLSSLGEAVAKGVIGAHGALGTRFRRFLEQDAGAKEQYARITGTKDSQKMKAEFRLKWATEELASKSIEKVQSQSFSTTFHSYGEYMSLERVIKKQGGAESKAAVRAAFTYAENCVKMGGEMLRYNDMTGRTDLFYVTIGQRDEFQKAWARHKRWGNTPEGEPAKKVARVDQAPKPETPVVTDRRPKTEGENKDGEGAAKLATPVKATGKSKATAKAKASSAEKPAGGEKGAGKISAKAMKSRKEYQEVVGSATTIVEAIAHNEEWEWARGNRNESALKEAIKALSDNLSKFATDFLLLGLQPMKGRMTPGDLGVELGKFSKEVDPLVEKVRLQVNRLTEMHDTSKRYA